MTEGKERKKNENDNEFEYLIANWPQSKRRKSERV
jgi:hypothetical protein